MYFQVIIWACWILATIILGTILHEGAHVVASIFLGRTISELTVLSLQLFPSVELSQWNGSLGSMVATLPNSERVLGIVDFSGSASTATASLLILFCLHKRNFRGAHNLLLASALILASDLILYAIMPLLGLPHYIFIGGKEPEPLRGFLLMGGSQGLFWTSLIALVSIIIVLTWYTKTPASNSMQPSTSSRD